MTPLLSELLQGILLLSVFALPVQAFAPAHRVALAAYFVLAAALLAVVRRRSARMWQLLLPAAAVLAAPAYVPFLPAAADDAVPRLILGVGAAVLVGRAVVQRYRPPADDDIGSLYTHVAAFFVLVALDVLAVWQEVPDLPTLYFALGVAYLLLALLRWHRDSLAAQMARYAATPTQPAARVVRYNRVLLAGSLVGTAVLLALSPLLGIDRILPWLGQRLLDLIRWLFSLLRRRPDPEPTPVPEPSAGPTPEPTGPLPTPETPAWVQFLWQALLFLFLSALAVLLAAGAAYGLYRLYRRFYEVRLPDRDRRESLLPGLVDAFEANVRSFGHRLRPPFARTPEERIRQACRRLVAAQARRGLAVPPAGTARDLLLSLDVEGRPVLREVLALYEKARYGPDACTPADAARMQRLVRGLAHLDLRRKPADAADAPRP